MAGKDTRTEQKLGFDRIRKMIADRCSTEYAAGRVEEEDFSTDAKEIRRRLVLTDEMRLIMMFEESFPASGFIDSIGFLKPLEYPSSHIDLISLRKLKTMLETLGRVLDFFDESKEGVYPNLKKMSAPIAGFPVVLQRIDGILDRFGEVGEYMKLEIKSALRNSVVRKQFLMGIFYMLLLSAMFAFSDVYDSSPFWKVFICVYSFSCLGVMTLTNVMCSEGNYIDGLMSRKESVLSILRAKYYFNVIMMVIPLIFMMMPVSEGKVSAVMVFGCLFFSAGVVFACLFQLAVYNNTTIHLNDKLTRSGRGTRMQMLISMVSMFAPMLVMMVLINLFSEQTASLVLLIIGAAGTLLHPLWLRNIYKRFMKRRYENMAGFRESRNV